MFTTLRAKLFAGYVLILLLLVALGGYAILSFRSLEEITSSGLEQNSLSVRANLYMYESLVRLNAAQLRMLAGETGDAHSVFEEETSQYYHALEQAKSAVGEVSPDLQQNFWSLYNDKIDPAWEDYKSRLPIFENLIRVNPTEARNLYNTTLSPEFNNLKDHNLNLSELNVEAFRAGKTRVVDRARNATLGVLIVTLIAIVLGIFGSYLIARRTTGPLRELTDSVKGLEAGRLDTRIVVQSADEIGDLSFEFNRLAERLREFEAMNINQIVREKRKSEAIIESIDDPLLLFDSNGALTLMNRASEEITGITEQTALGRPLSQLFRDKRLLKEIEHAIEQAAREVGAEDSPSPPIVMIERKSRQRYFRLRVARIIASKPAQSMGQTESPPLVWVLVFFTDITHFKELDRLKSDFIAKVSHEFRTPLTSMTMALDILHMEMLGKLNVEQHDIINTSKSDAARLAKLIRDLLNLARLESGERWNADRATTEAEVVDVPDALDRLIRSLRPMFHEKGVVLEADVSTDATLVMPEEHLVSITSNLLSNALKYTARRGSVELRVLYDSISGTLTLSVRDSGIGIAIEDQKRIFEKFVQVKPTNSSTPGSVGLGLAIVTEIASRYNGTVELQSTVGEGSTFTVKLNVKERVVVGQV